MMTLNLIDPLGSNFLKDFPGQNANNLDQIDAAAGPSLATQPLRSFVPVLTATGGLNPSIGTDGTNTANYYKIWDHVYAWGQVVLGSGFTTGTGTWLLEMPFTIDSVIGAGGGIGTSAVIGQGWINDASTAANRVPITVHQRDLNRLMFGFGLNAPSVNRDVRDANVFFSWAQGDALIWNAQFKVLET